MRMCMVYVYMHVEKGGICLVLGSTPKKYASRYYLAQSGTWRSRDIFLARIKPNAGGCGETGQIVEHLYTQGRKWRRQRRKLVRELKKRGMLIGILRSKEDG